MLNGTCPKCGRNTIHSGKNVLFKAGSYGGNRIPLTAFTSAPLDNYVCVACGYVESYIHDAYKLEKIAREWPRVESEK